MTIAELWASLLESRLVPPERPLIGYALLSLYAILFLVLLGRSRASLKPLTRRRLLALAGLGLAAPFAGRLLPLPIQFENQLPPLAAVQNPATTLTLLAAIPSLLGAATLGPAAALLIGFCAGLGRALWQSHQLFDPFHYALSAYLAAVWLQQAYSGRIYRWLRQPLVAGFLSSLSQVPLVILATFAYAEASESALAAFDLGLSTAGAYLLLVAAEGILAGLVVSLLLMGLPNWRPTRLLTPSPQEHSLRVRLLTNFTLFAAALIVTFLILVYYLSVSVATHLVVDQMTHDAQGVVGRLPDFMGGRLSLLSQYGQDDALLNGDQASQIMTLRQLFHAGAYYRRVLLVSGGGRIEAFYPPPDNETIQLTGLEETAVANVLATTAPAISPVQPPNGDHHAITILAPVLDANEKAAAVLVGRVPDVSFNELIAVLQGTAGRGSGFIVDQNAQIIAHPDPATRRSTWTPPVANRRLLATPEGATGVAYEGRDSQTNARQLVYYETAATPPWTVVTTVPYEVVLSLALQISAPLTTLLLVATSLFALNLRYLGRSLTTPLTELVAASQGIAGGQLDTPIQLPRQDEVGQLGQALDKMRLALRERLEELSLLLRVSQNVTSTIDVNQGMPEILRGVLQGTGAAGARVVVLNPSGRYPLLYEQGPAAPQMALLDRKIMRQLRQSPELCLSDPSAIRTELEVEAGHELPVQSLLALPLLSQKRIQGVLWLGYRQPHTFEPSELNLLRTLAGQAAILVENARLFATAESGRRRLAAVLASTADAVIVTDPTERILLINPAMEKAFGLKAAEAVGRPVAAVLKAERLVEALTRDGERARNVEVTAVDGRTLYANPSSIVSADGQVVGRVAVLHDVTHLKELDTLKSEFVSTVSHDLRDPLTVMRGYATMLPMVGGLNEKQQLSVEKILGGIDQMAALVNDLLDLGRIEAGLELTMAPLRLDELLRAVAHTLAQPAQARGLSLRVETPAHLPAVQADPALIRQAVTNLVNNAIKYAPNSGPLILRAAPEGQQVVISVQDHGPGIPRQEQMRLFEKFYRVRPRTPGAAKAGTGLGLAIVKSIAERHGGRAWCQSQVGQGSTFYISLPLK